MDKIICVGKNYLEHAKELGDAIPEKPVLFIKPPSVLRSARAPSERLQLNIPIGAAEVHHECEIVVKINRDGYRMTREQARAAISEVTLGLDMTLRDVQAKLKKQGHPWEISKTFLDSAIVGTWLPVADACLNDPFELLIDGQSRQRGVGNDMSLKPDECVAYASEHFPLKAGDLIFTGTPAGVGPVRAGQKGELHWGGRVLCSVEWVSYSE